ncbi:MAG: hypothetical protein MUF07_01840 [Steroidobacteraceae bacterium]|nr:hypothetical protein [Steroidobacteraceae bacterium]
MDPGPADPSTAAATSRRPYLAVFRAARRSVHRRILAEDPGRNWDCAVNWWQPPEDDGSPAPEELAFEGGHNKYDGFAAFFARALREDWGYRYVLLADDDVYFRPGDLSRYFEICERQALRLSQPALRWGTHVNHVVTQWNPMARVRNVSFVEVMTPCFDAATLRELVPTFGGSVSTFGIDWAWGALLAGRSAIHVVDDIRVDHLRPVDWSGGPLYVKLKAMGVDAAAEMREHQARYGGFGGIRTHRRGHVSRVLPGTAVGDGLVVAADRAIRLFQFLRDRAFRIKSRLLGRHVPAFPGDSGDRPPGS